MGEYAQPVVGMESCFDYSEMSQTKTEWRACEWCMVRKAEVQISENSVLRPYVRMGVEAREQVINGDSVNVDKHIPPHLTTFAAFIGAPPRRATSGAASIGAAPRLATSVAASIGAAPRTATRKTSIGFVLRLATYVTPPTRLAAQLRVPRAQRPLRVDLWCCARQAADFDCFHDWCCARQDLDRPSRRSKAISKGRAGRVIANFK